jgi:hypothetical protein
MRVRKHCTIKMDAGNQKGAAMWFIGPAVLVLFVVLGLVIFKRQQKTYLTQYFFFLRYPIVIGVLLIGLPFMAPWAAPTSLTNLFVLGWKSTLVVSLIACLSIWSTAYVFMLIKISIPYRCQLPFYRDSTWQDAAKADEDKLIDRNYDLIPAWGAAASLLILGEPLAIRIVAEPDGPWWANLLAIFGGVAVAWIIRAGSSWYAKSRRERKSSSTDGKASSCSDNAQLGATGSLKHVYGARDSTLYFAHARALRFFISAFVIYLLLGIAACPTVTVLSDVVPPLAIVLALLMLSVWVLGFIAFVFDRDRIPVIAVVVTVLVFLQSVRPTTIQFQVSDWGAHKMVDSTDALNAWSSAHPSKRPAIVVAASGGGIRAALWTAEVLAGLEHDVPGFHDRIALISAVSGGSVGTAYYVDRFTKLPSDPAQLTKLVDDAGTSSLTAAVWGFGYPDLWRGLLGNLLNRWDRGWALEQAWGHHMERPRQTLGNWADDAAAGLRPLTIFNATIQESGERLLLSPAGMPAQNGLKDLFTFVPKHDMAVLTAVRLSASFPYVSPQASPDLHGDQAKLALHVADGGYYDNSGLLSCIDALDRIVKSENANFPKRIALIEIRASGRVDEPIDVEPDSDVLRTALIGPLDTLYNVQGNSQIVRTNWELSLKLDDWNQRFHTDCQHFVFHLSAKLPLSWQLTDDEKLKIKAHWPTAKERAIEAEDARKDNEEELQSLQAFLH